MRGKESYVVLNRLLWIIVLTVFICIDMLIHGGFSETAKYLAKWGTWLTYATFMFSLNACSPLPNDSSVLLKSYKNNPFSAWKWYTVLFQISFTLEIVTTLTFWVWIQKEAFKNQNMDWKARTVLIVEHFVPLIALFSEYLLTDQPFVKRHWLIVTVIQGFYILVVCCYTIAGHPPYEKASKWTTLAITGFYIAMCVITLVVFFSLEFFTRKKL